MKNKIIINRKTVSIYNEINFLEPNYISEKGSLCQDYRISEFIFEQIKFYPDFLDNFLIKTPKINNIDDIYKLISSLNKYFDIEENDNARIWLQLNILFEESILYLEYQKYFKWLQYIHQNTIFKLYKKEYFIFSSSKKDINDYIFKTLKIKNFNLKMIL